MKIKAILPDRISDSFGEGHYGARRGKRTHKGRDLNCPVGAIILSNQEGEVTKIGYPYADDLSFRYVQITSADKTKDYRFFYVEPSVKVGDKIKVGDVLGSAQDLGWRYKGISNHIHFEVKVDGVHVDPSPYMGE